MDTDYINKPPHYTKGKIECIDYLKDSMNIISYVGFLEGNAKKYLHRYQYKGSKVSDLEKSQFYISKLIETYKELEEGYKDE
jgi:hypothetical protein